MTDPQPLLEYAPPADSHRRRRRFRNIAMVIVILAAAALGYRFGPPVKNCLDLIVAQRNCAAGPIKPGMVVFDDDPQRAAALLANGKDYERAPSEVPNGAVLRVPDAVVIYPANRLVLGYPTAPIFVGELLDDAGNPVIVVVDAYLQSGPHLRLDFSYWCDAAAPRSLAPLRASSGGTTMLGSTADADDPRFRQNPAALRTLTLYAGKLDSHDRQQFTAAYAINGVGGTIRFRLHSVGNAEVTVLDGPLTPENAHVEAMQLLKRSATGATAPAKGASTRPS